MRVLKKIQHISNAFYGYDRSDPFRNGEYKFLRSYLKENMIVFDVGANIGEYARYVFSIMPKVKIFCFEPVYNTYIKLVGNLAEEIQKKIIICNNLGLSNDIKESEIIIYNEYDGRNSIHFNPLHKYNRNILRKEKVKLYSLTKYVQENNIPKIDFLKIDVEGHEIKVIEGALDLIKSKMIKCIQFEYNNNWKSAGFKIEDLFGKLTNYQFKLYRLTIWGKISVNHFNKKLENYKHANYVAILFDT